MQVFGTQGSGNIHADFSGVVPIYHVHYSLTQFSVEEFFRAASLPVIAMGRMDFLANLMMQGNAVKELRRTANGPISLRGKNLTLSGTDLDRGFSRFESSQKFNLVDLGAVFFAGPLGLLITKGYNFASIYQGAGGSTEIPMLISDWTLERGVAQAQDVAMATKENRVALHGGLNFVNDEFDDVTMALINSKGCAKVRQKIHGTFQNPVVENPNPLNSFAGPALRLLNKGSDFIRGKQCDVFYAGLVPAPK
jgi:AsmA protein